MNIQDTLLQTAHDELKVDLVIDSDTHVEEHPAVWESIAPEFAARKPVTVKIDTIPDRPKRDVHWFIDGDIMPRRMGHGHTCHGSPVTSTFGRDKSATVEEQAILTARARLDAMDKSGVDVHVVYPTVFLQNLTKDLKYEAGLMRCYNDYIGERAANSGGRLRWIATVPIRDVPAATDEMRRVKAAGRIRYHAPRRCRRPLPARRDLRSVLEGGREAADADLRASRLGT